MIRVTLGHPKNQEKRKVEVDRMVPQKMTHFDGQKQLRSDVCLGLPLSRPEQPAGLIDYLLG